MEIDLSAFIAAQLLSQIDEPTREKLFVEAVSKVLDKDRIQQLLKEEITKIAKEEVQKRLETDLQMRSKIIDLVNGAFAKIFEDNQEDLKAKLAKNIIESMVRDRY